jgi:hypothetical protein
MMKASLSAAGLVGLAIVTVSPMAQAAQPQATPAYIVPETATPPYTTAPQAPAGAHYVWIEGYEKGGEWRGRWVLIR